jgi:hypothetical protein
MKRRCRFLRLCASEGGDHQSWKEPPDFDGHSARNPAETRRDGACSIIVFVQVQRVLQHPS